MFAIVRLKPKKRSNVAMKLTNARTWTHVDLNSERSINIAKGLKID